MTRTTPPNLWNLVRAAVERDGWDVRITKHGRLIAVYLTGSNGAMLHATWQHSDAGWRCTEAFISEADGPWTKCGERDLIREVERTGGES